MTAERPPDVGRLLSIADPHNWITRSTTDRLIPRHHLERPEFLTRALGGWAPIYFGVFGIETTVDRPDDPLLSRLRVLADHGSTIRHLGSDPGMVEKRLSTEMGDLETSTETLRAMRPVVDLEPQERAETLLDLLEGSAGPLSRTEHTEFILFDELMDSLVEIEQRRRRAHADHDDRAVDAISVWQEGLWERRGVHLLLKGEYIMGRHRRSTVLLAPSIGVVVTINEARRIP